MKHDIESYIITIKRKGQMIAGQDVVATPAVASASASPVAVPATVPAPVMAPTSDSVPTDSPTDSPAASRPKANHTSVTAPLPGVIVGIAVKPGDQVREGQELAILEAMKMENSIEAPCSGTVRQISVSIGDTVSEGAVILTIE